MDLNYRELHCCLESVTPSHHSSSELNFRDDLHFYKLVSKHIKNSFQRLLGFKAVKGFNDQMVYYFVFCIVRVNLFFHKKCTGGMSVCPGVDVTAGKESKES